MKNSSSNQSLRNVNPVLVFCYICGREFGSKSFPIHIKTCQEKFKNQQDLKSDPKDKISRTLVSKLVPEPPQLFDVISSGSYESNQLKLFNQEAYQIYKYKVLPKCKYCDRTFNFESLKVHEKGCDKRPKTIVCSENEDKELSRPKTLLCCVCGRQFGTKSLKIHYPQCLDKFKNDEFIRFPNPKDRRIPPQFSPQQIELFNTKENWSNEEIEEFYKMAIAKYRDESMMECYNCKRKFIPESIEKHMKNCILINGNLNPEGHMKKVQSEKVIHFYEKNIKKPKTLACYICGRQFGLTSLTIHQKTCYQKFKAEQQNKPKNERKKLPELPEEIIDGNFDISNAQNWQFDKIERYNKIISDLYNKKTLTQCYICQRTFFEESLVKHLVHCENNLQKLKLKRNKSSDENQIVKRCQSVRQLRKMEKSVQKAIVKPRVLTCHICGRDFGTSSLQIHLKVCTEKFINEQSQKQKQKRKPLPELPQQVSVTEYNIASASQWSNEKIEFYNTVVSDYYNKKTLQMCPYCERTFLQESLQKHIKHCEKHSIQRMKIKSLQKNNDSSLSKNKTVLKKTQSLNCDLQNHSSKKKLEPVQPKILFCHICGQQFGVYSLKIHLPQCKQKFLKQEERKPEEKRKKLPQLSFNKESKQNIFDFNIDEAQLWNPDKIKRYNEICRQIYMKQTLYLCQHCGRSFKQQQLPKHLKFCEKDPFKKIKKVKEQKPQRQTQQSEEKQQDSLRKKVRFEDKMIENMTIIEEEQAEHSTISPPYKKTSPQEENRKRSVTDFCLTPIQATKLYEKQMLQNNIKQSTTTKNLNSSYTNLNKSFKDPSLKKEASITRIVKRSISFIENIAMRLQPGRNQEEKNEKQCEHCKKKVKVDLYQRHIHMCKSNSSMTGYIKKDTNKLKL